MEAHEEILSIRVKKFKENMSSKHTISATFLNAMDKLTGYLDTYEVDYETIEKVYDLIYWSESHDNFKEIEAEFRNLADTFWD